MYSHIKLGLLLVCINRVLSTNVDVLKGVHIISKPISNKIPNMLVFVVVMSML